MKFTRNRENLTEDEGVAIQCFCFPQQEISHLKLECWFYPNFSISY
ncbi:hypothetical protein [Nostoc foliaceum]|nr:hypothetical protein [Nostoc foliaceum]